MPPINNTCTMQESEQQRENKCVWLDCDPGHDDVFAIILAGYSTDRIRLLGISTVACNQTVEHTTENALRAIDFYGLHGIPVVQGQPRPLIKASQCCPEIHGSSGLDGLDGEPCLPPASSGQHPIRENAMAYIYDSICKEYNKGTTKVNVVATGALTNIALLIILYPEIVEMMSVTCMAGSIGAGNTGPVSEFNVQTDPHAFHRVLSSGVDVTMVPLEVTHTALCTPRVLERIQSIGDASSLMITKTIELLTFFADTYKKVFKFSDPPLHDPCAVAYVLDPSIFSAERLYVHVDTSLDGPSSGQTIVDIWHHLGKEPNANVCMTMNTDAFWDYMIHAIQRAHDSVHPTIQTPSNML